VLNLVGNEVAKLPALKITLRDSYQNMDKYAQMLNLLPCALKFMFVAELNVSAKPNYARHDQTRVFGYKMIWTDKISSASNLQHPKIKLMYREFEKRRQPALGYGAIQLTGQPDPMDQPRRDFIRGYQVTQVVSVHLCASFTQGPQDINSPYLMVYTVLVLLISGILV
jgi:hypothetical protein